jgi:hypothetical protein
LTKFNPTYNRGEYNGGVFRMIDKFSNGFLDFGNIAQFFEESNIRF